MFSENRAGSSSDGRRSDGRRPDGRRPDGRVLAETLRHVRKRRLRRQRTLAVVTTSAMIAVAILWQGDFSRETVDAEAPKLPVITTNEAPVIQIQRIGRGDGGREGLIKRSSHLGDREKLAITSRSPRLIIRVSDGELLASLPENQLAGLLKNSDGSSRLVFLLDSNQTQ